MPNPKFFLVTHLKSDQQILPLLTNQKYQSNYIFINPTLILDLFHLSIATNKALTQKDDERKTRSLSTQIIYNLSHTSGISESLKMYGFGKGMNEVILISIDGSVPEEFGLNENANSMDCHHQHVEIRELQQKDLNERCNMNQIKKVF